MSGNNSMNSLVRMVLSKLLSLRTDSSNVLQMSSHVDGFVLGLYHAGVFDDAEYRRLSKLCLSAFFHSGEPFISQQNAGPFMPSWVALERRESVKPQAEVVNETTQRLPALASCRELRLLCVLDRSRIGEAPRSLPIHTVRPMPPRICSQGRWALKGHSGIYLRETYAKPAPPEVLARSFQYGQTDAFRADPRTIY